MTLANTRLAERFAKLVQEVADTFISMSELREKVGEMFEVGYKLDISDKQIKEKVKELTKGRISERTLQRWLPDRTKDKYMKALAERSHVRRHQSADDLVDSNNKEIEIPVKHTIKDAPVIMTGETIQDADHMVFRKQIKADRLFTEEERQRVDEIMTTPTFEYVTDVILDCNKFRSELRTGLLNSAKLKLEIRNNGVVKIT